MIFSVDRESEELQSLPEQDFATLEILEREDLEDWAIQEPRLLGEDLLIITSEYANFVDTWDRLDLLAMDKNGKLVVVELKRDRADDTTDLQAIKYASYCATLTAEDVQQDYREFWSNRRNKKIVPEDVGEAFAEFLADEIPLTDDGWANFDLDDKPRILLAAGSFGTELTSPIIWLAQEYGMDITCIRIEAYEHQGRILLNSQQVIPVSEAEEYMTKRREKQETQESSTQRQWTLPVLLENGILVADDIILFAQDRVPPEAPREWDSDEDYWRAKVTGNTGQQDALEWLYDGNTYSFTGLSKEILQDLVGRNPDKALNGYKFWCHPEFENNNLYDLRSAETKAPSRKR